MLIFFQGPCNITLPTRLDCIAPNITDITGEINNASVIVQIGFAMQRVKSVESIENITVRGDPVFEKFGIKDLRRRNLFLKVLKRSELISIVLIFCDA